MMSSIQCAKIMIRHFGSAHAKESNVSVKVRYLITLLAIIFFKSLSVQFIVIHPAFYGLIPTVMFIG